MSLVCFGADNDEDLSRRRFRHTCTKPELKSNSYNVQCGGDEKYVSIIKKTAVLEHSSKGTDKGRRLLLLFFFILYDG